MGNFTIRVYGLITNGSNEVLISDEFQLGMKMTKFPGGGLEFGEGTVDCLKREFLEECNGQKICSIKHFYTTDFYQKALFFEDHQLISIYYLAQLKHPVQFTISENSFDFDEKENGKQSFRWVPVRTLDTAELTFPIDKIVAKKLKKAFTKSLKLSE